MTNDSIKPINVLTNEKENIFASDKYIIPLYQREFAWEEKQLEQLIGDIDDININEQNNYYLGSLIVYNNKDKYEVIDGQQRLTALFLLLNCLNFKVENNLEFSCRKKSNYTLKNINNLTDDDLMEDNIKNGMKILKEKLKNTNNFIEKLKKVIIYRIEVPEYTDLNHYFEIMNTRGEQLEQQDILKAELMRYLTTEDSDVFATVWDACSDMTGYVQMHFISENNKIRNGLFGNYWNNIPNNLTYQNIRNIIISDNDNKSNTKENDNDKNTEELTIEKIISPDFKIKEDNISDENNEDIKIRFESIIDFPYFLLHTLKVLFYKSDNKNIIPEQLDDKKLCETFEDVINAYKKDKEADFSKDFIACLLKTRFLFDKYIIKREYKKDNSDGEWSLKYIKTSKSGKSTTAYPKNTYDDEDTNKKNLMIQSALRVSYTSPKSMHWITQLLKGLYENETEYSTNYAAKAEEIAKEEVSDFIKNGKNGNYSMGVETPHIVLNFLDYIIWRDKPKEYDFLDYDNFVFEFRNSVEHWYPRNPSEGTILPWQEDEKDGCVDRFGNLCLVQRNINSKFSNLAPQAKKDNYEKMIAKGSLKLQIMSKFTQNAQNWKNETCEDHENKMLDLLRNSVEKN